MATERRKRHRISNGGAVIETDGVPVNPNHDIHVPEPEPPAPYERTQAVPAGLEGVTALTSANTTALDREVADARSTLNPLLAQAEEVVRDACKPLHAKQGWIDHVYRAVDWPAVSAQVMGETGRPIPNLHIITVGAREVYGMASTFQDQLNRIRLAVQQLGITRRETNPHGFRVHVRTLEKQLRALITDTDPAVTRALTSLTDAVERAEGIVAKCTGASTPVVRAKNDDEKVVYQTHYASFRAER